MAKDEKGDEKKKKEEREVTCVEYKVSLHCRQCARKIQKTLKRCKGVEKVEADIENGKITVIGKFDSKEIHTLMEKISKRKVEIASVKTIKIEVKDTEKVVFSKTVLKVQMHCQRCEHDLRRKIQKLKGVKTVTTNRESHICIVDSSIEQEKLIEYVRKATGKHVEIVTQKEKAKESKEDKKVEKKEEKKEEKKDEKKEEKKDEEKKDEKKEEKKDEKKEDKGSKKEDKSEEGKGESETPVPYFVHCTHAPQLFSDENPNACFVM